MELLSLPRRGSSGLHAGARRGCLLFALVLTALSLLASRDSQARDGHLALAIIVAQSSPLRDVPHNWLRRVYLGRQSTTPQGARVVPLNHPARSTVRVAFDSSVLGMSPEEATKYWIDRRIRGHGHAPTSIERPELIPRVVAKLEGAIGFVRPSNLAPGVKVLRVDGKAPGEPGYLVVH